ncbi:MAG TPA: pitrilysin family protein [Pyrinomonadaceae bacterium]|nr:pitrilysin family protein [Pyrinomonadaceae bacterium]
MRTLNSLVAPRLLLAFLLLANSAPAAFAQTTADRPPAQAGQVPKVAFEKYTLSNGLQVVLHVDKKLPVVHVNQWFHVGSKNEKLNRTGFAHLFEHMMFQGSKNAAGEYFGHVERLGATDSNGTTNFDRTNYFATVPSANLEYLIWLEADRLATMLDVLDKAKLDNQRDVVKNERRQGLENQPYGKAFMLITENVFPKGHPYSWDVIGSHEDLTAASVEDVKDFFRTFYTPNNLSLVITGDFDPAEAKRLVEKYFGTIPPGPALERHTRWIPRLETEKVIEVKDRVPQERVYINWPTPPLYDKEDGELDLIANILADGLSSRLNKSLVFERQIASDVFAFQASREIASVFTVIATARPGSSLAQVEQIITDEIARLAKDGPTADELNRAKTKWEYNFVTNLERIGGFGGKADQLNSYNTYMGEPGGFERDFARYRDATVASVRETAAKWLATRNRLVLRFRPEPSGRESQVAIDRTQIPKVGADRAFTAPQVQSARLENGMQVYVVERHEIPKVAVMLSSRTGSVYDPSGKAGLAHLTMTTLDKGTKTRNTLQVADAFADLGATLHPVANFETSTVAFEVLKRNLSPALAVFSDVVRNPSFPETEVERMKKIHLDALAQESNDPGAIRRRLRTMLAFGAEHPYGRPRTGLPSTVQTLTRADLARFHETNVKPANSALIFAGDITLAEATELARQHFGSWAGAAPPAVQIPEAQGAGAGKVFLIDRQDAAQTAIALIVPAPQRKTEDFYALSLADTVWGGAFQSRLNLNLREDKGYAYGAGSFHDAFTRAGYWAGQANVQTDKTKESVTEFINELRALAGGKPISEEELTNARTTRVRGYALEFETLGQLAGKVNELLQFDLPPSELQRAPELLSSATLASVNAAAQKYAVPGRATLLVIGDRSKIEKGLRELNLGEIIVLDVEGKPITR